MIARGPDNPVITTTFPFTLTQNFYQFNSVMPSRHKICDNNIPVVSFPSDVVINANEKHYNNKKKVLSTLKNLTLH